MKDTYLKVIEHFGTDAQKVKTLEELSELQVEIVRDLNGKGNIDAIIEETADVMNMVEQICIIYDIEDLVKQMKIVKMHRTMEKIKPKGKTILQDLLEKYPNAKRGKDGVPKLCPSKLGYSDTENCSEMSFEECIDCWNRPVEEKI